MEDRDDVSLSKKYYLSYAISVQVLQIIVLADFY